MCIDTIYIDLIGVAGFQVSALEKAWTGTTSVLFCAAFINIRPLLQLEGGGAEMSQKEDFQLALQLDEGIVHARRMARMEQDWVVVCAIPVKVDKWDQRDPVG